MTQVLILVCLKLIYETLCVNRLMYASTSCICTLKWNVGHSILGSQDSWLVMLCRTLWFAIAVGHMV